MNMISLRSLYKYYGKKRIITNISVDINNDSIYFLTAENGKGKSTFFKCLLRETNYQGIIEDRNIVYAYLPEKVMMPSFISVNSFLKAFLEIDSNSYDELLVDEMLDKFKISEYKNSYINELSKGTKQKVLIIKTLLSNADVYLFDEPLSGLDKRSRDVFIEEVYKLNKDSKGVIIASHYYNEYKYQNKEVIALS